LRKEIAVVIAGALLATAGSAQAQRIHDKIDDGWRFLRDNARGAEAADFDDQAWRTIDLPHDYSIEELSPGFIPDQLVIHGNGWLSRPGDEPGWSAQNLDESAWKPVDSRALTAMPSHSYAWFRRRITVPTELKGKDVKLVIGKVDDADVTYVNGVQVGSMGSFPPEYTTAWDTTRRYPVPAGLLKGDGTDVVAVRVYNGEAGGGIVLPGEFPGVRTGPFDSDAPGGAAEAYTVGGPAWYRKVLDIPKDWRGRKVTVEFDGAYHDATVWLNGHQVGAHAYGYTSFSLDLTPNIDFGRRNVLAVRLDTSGHHSRWYSGSGLYRHVWLTVTPPLRFAQWGVSVTTPRVEADSASVAVRARILHDAVDADTRAVVRFSIRDAAGHVVTSGEEPISLVTQDVEPSTTLTVKRPLLWSPEHPSIYTLHSEIVSGGKATDAVDTRFGIRTISFDAEHGFLLNGKPTKLHGGCVHHDNGPLGSAAYDRAEERRVELLKAAGYNAIRTSHNPVSPVFLETCDRLGMLVIDEAFDQWSVAKTPMDYARFFEANWQADIRSMIERDRHHPCVIVWSIGNEIPEQMTSTGAAEAKELATFVHALDPTRPVTAAFSGGYGAGRDEFMAALDVAGYNYKRDDYVKDHEQFPARIIVSTESVPKEAFEYWDAVERHPYVIGDFVWTAFDYLGEAGIGRVKYPGEADTWGGLFPWTVANCGDIDITGHRRPQSYYRGILWNVGPKVTAFVDAVVEGDPGYTMTYWGWPDESANWTWPGSEGKNRTVRVYARTPRVRLVLNGRSLGEKETTPDTHYTATYSVPYEPGELDAIGLDEHGGEVERWSLKTAGAPARIRLTPDRKSIDADGEDLVYIVVELLDKDGNLCTNAATKVSVALAGPGKLLALGSGKPTNIESYVDVEHSAFEGRLIAIVKSTRSHGNLTLTATADGLPSAKVSVKTQ